MTRRKAILNIFVTSAKNWANFVVIVLEVVLDVVFDLIRLYQWNFISKFEPTV
jgi:hypothetical protein